MAEFLRILSTLKQAYSMLVLCGVFLGVDAVTYHSFRGKWPQD